MAISMKGKTNYKTTMNNIPKYREKMLIQTYLDLHDEFIRDKELENLSDRTIKDHIYIFKIFSKWLLASDWSYENQYVQKALFIDYKDYMINEKIMHHVQ
ncbi:hypothetical protein [Helicovermis profundi]|uniref:Uncharacterized protein n=1 Tax=Helicovermis profundi TaxID=3065157 RepID=A0AAU9EG31_9FIRM|nr:hypothetical protein HLPR_20480 [Clostridia bacterium S502]